MNDHAATDDEEDTLLVRVLERQSTPADIEVLEQRLTARPELLHEWLDTLRDDALLRAALAVPLVAATRVELPQWSVAAAVAAPGVDRGGSGRSFVRLAAAGWLVAAVLAVALLLPGGAAPAHQPEFNAAPDALAARVIGELPLQLVETRALPGDEGRVEVLYLRPVLERAQVQAAFRFGLDESGAAVPVSFEPALLASRERL